MTHFMTYEKQKKLVKVRPKKGMLDLGLHRSLSSSSGYSSCRSDVLCVATTCRSLHREIYSSDVYVTVWVVENSYVYLKRPS